MRKPPLNAQIPHYLVVLLLLSLLGTCLAEEPSANMDESLLASLKEVNHRFNNVHVSLIEWPEELQSRLGNLKPVAFFAKPIKQPEEKLPLLVALHGAGGKTMTLERQLTRSANVKGLHLAELAAQPLVLLEPNSRDAWDPRTLNHMLDHILNRHPEIDPNRVYVMGHSMGGRGTWEWILDSADRFAAAAPCGFQDGDGTADLSQIVNLPIWAMVGGMDGKNTKSVERMNQRLKAAGNTNVRLTIFPKANHAQANAAVFSSTDLVQWMLEFSRNH